MEQYINIYPNPVAKNDNVNIIVNSLKAASIELSLIDFSGKTLIITRHTLQNGRNQLNFNVKNILPGAYILRIHSDYFGDSYSKLMVLQ